MDGIGGIENATDTVTSVMGVPSALLTRTSTVFSPLRGGSGSVWSSTPTAPVEESWDDPDAGALVVVCRSHAQIKQQAMAHIGIIASGLRFRASIGSGFKTSALGVPGLKSTRGVNAKAKLDYRPTTFDSAQVTSHAPTSA